MNRYLHIEDEPTTRMIGEMAFAEVHKDAIARKDVELVVAKDASEAVGAFDKALGEGRPFKG